MPTGASPPPGFRSTKTRRSRCTAAASSRPSPASSPRSWKRSTSNSTATARSKRPACRCARMGKLVATLVKQARKACPGAIVGKGHGHAVVAFPESKPISVDSPITLFNGPRKHGDPTVIAHAYTTYPAPVTLLVPITIETIHKGVYGYRTKRQDPEDRRRLRDPDLRPADDRAPVDLQGRQALLSSTRAAKPVTCRRGSKRPSKTGPSSAASSSRPARCRDDDGDPRAPGAGAPARTRSTRSPPRSASGDCAAAAACFTREGCMITPDGTAVHGRAEVGGDPRAADRTPHGDRGRAARRAPGRRRRPRHRPPDAALRRPGRGRAIEQTCSLTLALRRIEGAWKIAILSPWASLDAERATRLGRPGDSRRGRAARVRPSSGSRRPRKPSTPSACCGPRRRAPKRCEAERRLRRRRAAAAARRADRGQGRRRPRGRADRLRLPRGASRPRAPTPPSPRG